MSRTGTRRPGAARSRRAARPRPARRSAWSSPNGTSFPTTEAVWRTPGPRRQPVDAGGQHRLHRRRHLNRRQRPRQPVGAALADQRPGLDERPHALLQEERIALRPLDQHTLERIETGIGPDQRAEELPALIVRQGVEPELSVVGATPPLVPNTPAGSSRGAAPGPPAGSRPARRAAPGSRNRSSGDPRRSPAAAAPGSPAAGAASARPESGGGAGTDRAPPTRGRRSARRAATGAPAGCPPARGPGSGASRSASLAPRAGRPDPRSRSNP